MIGFRCHECGSSYQAKDELAGKKTKCRKCGSEIRISATAPEEGVTRNPPSARFLRAERDDAEERDEGDYPSVRRAPPADDSLATLIPYKNPKALIAYYCGVFGLIPMLGLVLAVAAVVLGMQGLRFGKEHPTAKGTGHAIVGIVLGILSLLGHFGCIVLVVLVAVASGKK